MGRCPRARCVHQNQLTYSRLVLISHLPTSLSHSSHVSPQYHNTWKTFQNKSTKQKDWRLVDLWECLCYHYMHIHQCSNQGCAQYKSLLSSLSNGRSWWFRRGVADLDMFSNCNHVTMYSVLFILNTFY